MHGSQMPWEATPIAGVTRRRLDRVVGNYERVTSLVHCEPLTPLSTHEHEGGEEVLVLEGSYEDDFGIWPEGSYIRNPPGSIHTPNSTTGCIVLMKLWQFNPYDRTFVHTNINKLEYSNLRDREGVSMASLYQDPGESVRIEKWAPETQVEFTAEGGGAELFVLKGSITDANDYLEPYSWLRVPTDGVVSATAGPEGAMIWIKLNHLAHM